MKEFGGWGDGSGVAIGGGAHWEATNVDLLRIYKVSPKVAYDEGMVRGWMKLFSGRRIADRMGALEAIVQPCL